MMYFAVANASKAIFEDVSEDKGELVTLLLVPSDFKTKLLSLYLL